MDNTRKPDTAADETLLAPLFAAARSEPVATPLPLVTAILADAAAVAAARAPSSPPSASVAAKRGRLATIGGWRGASALAACAALGFWVGLAGGITFDGGSLQTASLATDAAADPVQPFFDLAAAE